MTQMMARGAALVRGARSAEAVEGAGARLLADTQARLLGAVDRGNQGSDLLRAARLSVGDRDDAARDRGERSALGGGFAADGCQKILLRLLGSARLAVVDRDDVGAQPVVLHVGPDG